jgi:hypothetical protein
MLQFLETEMLSSKKVRSSSKYKDLIIENQRMWNVKVKVLPVMTGATGTISKSLRHYLSNIAREREIKGGGGGNPDKQTNKKSHIGHCTHTAGSANVKVQNIFHGCNNITCSTNCKYRTTATLRVYPWHMVCFRYITVNSLHKGDKDNDDDDDEDNNNNNNTPLSLKFQLKLWCQQNIWF